MQKRSKVLLSLAVALIMVFALTATALAADYTNHWSNTFVTDAISKGWIATDANGNVQPDALTTRGAYALMMWKSLGSPTPTKANPFTDVPDTSPYYNAVRALFEAGVTTGMTPTTFGLDVNLTREMACTMLVRAHKLSPVNPNAYQNFADHPQISEYARQALSVMEESKYVEGIGNNMFAPKQNLKNGEMIKIVMNVANGVAAKQQQSAAAMAAIVQQQNSGTLSLKLTLRVESSHLAYVVVEADDSAGSVDFIGSRLQQDGDSAYTSTTGFTKVSGNEFEVKADGTYVVCVTNKKGGFITKTISVKGLDKSVTIPSLDQDPSDDDKSVVITIENVVLKDVLGYVFSTTEPTKIYTENDFKNKADIKTSGNDCELEVTKNGWYAIGIKTSKGVGFVVVRVKDIKGDGEYKITFDKNGGSGTMSTVTVNEGDDYTIPSNKFTAPSGKSFTGWNTKANGSGDAYAVGDKINDVDSSITLYAQWGAAGSTYTVTVTSGSGGGSYASGVTVNITANTAPSGKVFDKWTTSSGVTFANANNASTSFTMPAKAVTVTATYKNDPSSVTTTCAESLTAGGTCGEQYTGNTCPNASAHGTPTDTEDQP